MRNFSSFQRLLNLHGFRRSSATARDAYFHPQFLQNQRDIAKLISRTEHVPDTTDDGKVILFIKIDILFRFFSFSFFFFISFIFFFYFILLFIIYHLLFFLHCLAFTVYLSFWFISESLRLLIYIFNISQCRYFTTGFIRFKKRSNFHFFFILISFQFF